MDFHYNSNINDFCRSMVKRDLERICNPQYNYRCGTEYKKASTTCDTWRATQKFCKDDLNLFTKGEGCHPYVTISWWLYWGC